MRTRVLALATLIAAPVTAVLALASPASASPAYQRPALATNTAHARGSIHVFGNTNSAHHCRITLSSAGRPSKHRTVDRAHTAYNFHVHGLAPGKLYAVSLACGTVRTTRETIEVVSGR
jgi:hypothetical protein